MVLSSYFNFYLNSSFAIAENYDKKNLRKYFLVFNTWYKISIIEEKTIFFYNNRNLLIHVLMN